MTWFDWTLISYLAIGAVGSVLLIGQPRGPIQPSTALLTLIVNAAIVAGLVVIR